MRQSRTSKPSPRDDLVVTARKSRDFRYCDTGLPSLLRRVKLIHRGAAQVDHRCRMVWKLSAEYTSHAACLLQEGVSIRIDEHGRGAHETDSGHRRLEGVRLCDDLIPRSYAQCQKRQDQGIGARIHATDMLHAHMGARMSTETISGIWPRRISLPRCHTSSSR
jgi:hypothetical protein